MAATAAACQKHPRRGARVIYFYQFMFASRQSAARLRYLLRPAYNYRQEGLAVASIARDDPSTLPGDNPFPRARMHRDGNAW